MFAVRVSRFQAGKCSSVFIDLGRHQAAEQGHEWHEEKLSWRPKKVWMAAYEKRIIIKLSSVFPILHFFFLVAEISFPFARDVQGRN